MSRDEWEERDALRKDAAVQALQLHDGDWLSVFQYTQKPEAIQGFTGSTEGFTLHDVDLVIAASSGANDEKNWLALTRLQDGRFAFTSAGCDYTGWG